MKERHGGRIGPIAVSLIVAWAALTFSCSRVGDDRVVAKVLILSAEGDLSQRLEAIVAGYPLPIGWTLAASGELTQAPAAAAQSIVELSLRAAPSGAAVPRGDAVCGSRYLAAQADIGENLYSVSASRAQSLGLSPLESVVLPRRALAVDGLWPGMRGYPFSQTLYLNLRRLKGRPDAALRKWLVSAAAAQASREPKPIEVAAAGDIQIGESEWPLLASGEAGLSSLLRDGVLDLLRRPDIAVANVEAPISARGYPNPRKRFRFRMPPGSGAALRRAGLGLVLFGNNHGFDFGSEAFEDTLADLTAAGLPMVGAGSDLARAAAPRFISVASNRLAFVGYAFFPNEMLGFTLAEAAAGSAREGVNADENAAMDSVRAAAASGATVIVLAHGGFEYVQEPSRAAKALYARFVDAGAALVLGSHPHLLQGCEARSGSLIAYSLGNFLFTGEREPPAALKSAILDFLVYRGRVRGIMIRPIVVGFDATEPDPDQQGAETRFSRLCRDLTTP